MKQTTILVTGGGGFVGRYVCQRLIEQGFGVRVPVRSQSVVSACKCEYVVTGDLTHFANWSQLLRGVAGIVHLVARTHVTDEFGTAAMQAYRAVNVDITRRIARAAKQQGVRRFVYLSSIKAVGNSSAVPIVESSLCRPVDSYGITKQEAEQAVRRQLLGSETSYTILRPPLVYGPGVKGNFLRLLTLVQRGVPLPRIRNQRSMIHIENLVDAICLVLEHDAARNQTFHVADPQPISTTDLVIQMATGLGTAARLVPLPQMLLAQLGRVAGKQEEIRRLVESLVVSNETIRTRLNWQPRLTTKLGVEQTSRAFATAPWLVEDRTHETHAIRAAKAA